MTGPEHFVEGERLLAEAARRDIPRPLEEVTLLTARAAAHFTAAEVAILAAVHHPKSVAWTRATKDTE